MTPDAAPSTALDVLRWPVVGRLLRWRHFRTSMQLVLLVAAVVVVIHGFAGPDIASGNLSTVLVWVHYRGLLVIALLAAGNLFCAGCPFIRVRDWGRLLHAPTWIWPARLRGKWIALALFVLVLFTYELFDLWALPRSTAWLVLAYFAGALAIDLLFTGATFCKHLCPIGQFNFVASTVSPFELRIREPATCDTCQTSDCIKGRRSAGEMDRIVQRGCELGLFLPAKVGNVDCTFCLDCVQACPHDNIAIGARVPALELADDRRRSGIGRLSARPDLALLAVLFVFGAFMNAFAMTAPAYRAEEWFRASLGVNSQPVLLGSLFLLGLGVAPAVVLGAAAVTTRLLAPAPEADASTVRAALSYAYGLVPLGFGVWLAHYGFHFLTGLLVVVPVTQDAVIDLFGWAALGGPFWGWVGMQPNSVLSLQLGCVLLGATGSIGVVHLISMRERPTRASRATLPWAVVIVAMSVAAVWILLQPMEMRGTGFGA